MSTQRPSNEPAKPQTVLKAEEYEPVADWLLQNGQRLAYHDIETEEPYHELSALDKFDALSRFYTKTRSGSIGYNMSEVIELVEEIVESPQAIDSSSVEMSDSRFSPDNPPGEVELEDEYPEVEVAYNTTRRTGDPEVDQAVRRLEGGEDESIEAFFTEPSDGHR